jgi:hypothetical protein
VTGRAVLITLGASFHPELPLMNRNISLALLAAVLGTFPSDPVSAAPTSMVLYDFTIQPASGGFITGAETGHSIQIDRPSAITELAITLESGPTFSIVEDFQVRLYTGSSLHGPPGRLLWTTVVENIVLSRQPRAIAIDVPEVIVPPLFTWTIEPLRNQYQTFMNGAFPPSPTGNFGTVGGAIYRDGGRWETFGPGSALSTRASGYFIPEPTTLALAAMLAGCGMTGRLARHS